MIALANAQRTGLFDILGRLWYLAASEKAEYQTRQTIIDNTAAALAAGAAVPAGQSQSLLRYSVEGLSQQGLGITETVLRLTRDIVQSAVAIELGRKLSDAEAARYIVHEALAGGYYVGTSTVSVVAQPDPSNLGDAQVLMAALTPDGYPGALWVPESGELVFDNSPYAASPDSQRIDSVLWPGGSGYGNEAIPLYNLEAGWLTNPGLSVSDNRIVDWLAIGTQWEQIQPPQDEIRFSATPTGGAFRLGFTNRFGVVRWTRDIAYNASPTAVAAEIARLDRETARVSVSARSGGPGYSVDWPRGRYDLPLLSVQSALAGATASVVRARDGIPGGYAGTGILFRGDGSERTGIYQRFIAQGQGLAYLVVRVWHDGAAAGTLQAGLVDGANPDASPVLRPSGADNAASFNLSGLAANQFHALVVPICWSSAVDGYITVRLSVPMTSGNTLAINWPQLVPILGQTLTRPGIVMLANRFGAFDGDRWQWTVTNDFAGAVQTWWLRAFADASLALPRSGTTLIPESIISP